MTEMTFGSTTTASRMRDAIRRIVSRQIEIERPRIQYATVNTIDRVNRKCTVTFPGADAPTAVTMGSLQPLTTGQTVRVEGPPGDKYITDVMGQAYFSGNASNADMLDNKDGAYFRYRGQTSTNNDVDHNEAYLGDPSQLNRFLAAGSYQVFNPVGGPPGLTTGWGWLEVHTHVGGAHWQRQVYKDMNASGYMRTWERFCAGGNPTLANDWSPWYPIQGPDIFGEMSRASNYDGPDNARYEVPMTTGTADNSRNAIYWNNSGRLMCRFTGMYEFTAVAHTTSTGVGVHSAEVNVTKGGSSGQGAEEYIAYTWQNGQTGGTWTLSSGPVRLVAGDAVRLVIGSPDGIAFHHFTPTRVRGVFLGPEA